MNRQLIFTAMQKILQVMEEGVHIVDANGYSIFYNKAMEQIEGLSADEVIGRHVLEVFPGLTSAESTLLSALESGKRVDQRRQSYLNLKKKSISTTNSTFPLFSGSTLIGAVEIAKNYTEVRTLSERIVDLQQRLMEPEPGMPASQNRKAAAQKTGLFTFDALIGRHPGFMAAVGIAKKAAKTDSSVLVEGETGTGKELFAQSIHSAGHRRDKAFIAVNCAAIPDTLLEGILFGTVKGSYTGAEDRPGLFEQAEGGTLFLDEINSMSLALQAKLLRAVQESSVRRLGGLKDISVDVRIIGASNEALVALMRAGSFRKDLYYRLNVINVTIPPLRDRPEDIPLFAEHFIRRFNEKMGKDVWMLSDELNAMFGNYGWVGNVRELQNVIESAMVMVSDEHVLGIEHLPPHMDLLNHRPGRAEARHPVPDLAHGLDAYMQRTEKAIVLELLEQCNGNISQAARKAGISRQNLQYKIRRYSILID